MAATLTASTYSVPVTNNIHAGNFSAHFKYQANGTSVSAGDTIKLGYIPQGVTVIDAYVWGAFGAAPTVKLGSAASISAIGTTTTISAAGMNRMVGFVPRRFSISADAEGVLRVPIQATVVAGTSTVTGSLNVLLILTNSPEI